MQQTVQARLTDEEVLQEYLALYLPGKQKLPLHSAEYDGLLRWVRVIREWEPRINSGVHLADAVMIGEGETFDTAFGTDYFEE